MTPLKIFQKNNQKQKTEIDKKETAVKEETNKTKINFLKVKPILVKPYISEKATDLKSLNKYLFEVGKEINKIEVKKFIEKLYNVKVEKVNFVIIKGKKKKIGRNITRFQPRKKAIVTLKEGYKIEI